MLTNFFSLPRELRDQIYELVLLQQEPVDPGDRLQNLTPGLLRANKAVHLEASSLFYAQNRFDFTTMNTSEEVASFLGQIGRKNADHNRHISIDFPSLFLKSVDATLVDDSIGILANIQSGCANLSTLTTCLYGPTHISMLAALGNPKIVNEALELVNTHFRTISSLQEIFVEVYFGCPSDHIRRKFESHGWTIRIIEDYDFDSPSSNYKWSDSDDDSDDKSYDIDNDSDFLEKSG